MARIFILLAATFLITSCGGDEEKAKGKWYEECAVDLDCETGFVCAGVLCTKKCDSSTEAAICTPLDTKAECIQSYCYIPCDGVYDCVSKDMECLNLGGERTCQPKP